MKQVTKYIAEDGREFESERECREHEATLLDTILANRSREQIRAALTRADVALADAIEQAGNIIAKARRDAGELRRRPRDKAAGEAAGEAQAGQETPAPANDAPGSGEAADVAASEAA